MEKEEVINIVCQICDVRPGDIRSSNRTRDISDARKLIAYVLLNNGICPSVPEVAKIVGLKRNSMYVALSFFEDLLRLDAPFRFRYNLVMKKLLGDD